LSLVAALEQLGIANMILYFISATIILIILISFFIAIRDFIPNVMAGFYLYSKEKLKDGNKIEINDIKGTLEHIDLLQVKIKTKKGDIIYIPNSTVIKSRIKLK
jgi:small conductance mechanosensitive channel